MNSKKLVFSILTLLALLVSSCKDSNVVSGSSLLDYSDSVFVDCDTFRMVSSLISPDTLGYTIYSTPDSFLLGECDSRFGTIHSDILAQFACPEGFRFPEGAVADSVLLYFYYTSWFGDGLSPMSISVYEMDKATFAYTMPYPNNLPIEDYCSLDDSTRLIENYRIIVPSRPTDSVYNSNTGTYMPFVRMRLSDAFTQRFFNYRNYSSQEAFTQQFKGLFLQSNFGSASLLHVSGMSLALYYHFEYQQIGVDTITRTNDVKDFYANTEVRQINRYVYLNQEELVRQLDTVGKNYVVSPANLYTRIGIPIKEMARSIYTGVDGKRPYVNKAELKLDVLNVYNGTGKKTCDDWAQPTQNMLLILEDSINIFFAKNRLPSDTCALLSTLTAGTENDSTVYYYSYDLSTLLTRAVRLIASADTATQARVPEYLNMLLVPVSVGTTSTSSSTTSVSSVKYEQTVTATQLRSASNVDYPLNLEVVFSGF